jgi:ribosomal protein S21
MEEQEQRRPKLDTAIYIGGNWDFEKGLKRLRNQFQKHVAPELRRHTFYMSKSQRRRLKRHKAILRQRKKESK